MPSYFHLSKGIYGLVTIPGMSIHSHTRRMGEWSSFWDGWSFASIRMKCGTENRAAWDQELQRIEVVVQFVD
jgi:hypothetical protein